MSDYPHVEKALAYCEGVLSGKIVAGKWVKLACKRHLDDLERAEKGWKYRFDPDQAEKWCRFVELMPHVKGRWAARREKLILEPFQCFIVCALYGWLQSGSALRRFRTALVMMARKNGKSPLAAALGLGHLTIDGEHGAEVYSGATSKEQAFEVFGPARLMVLNTPEFKAAYDIEVTKESIFRRGDNSRFKPIVGNPGDGPAPSFAPVDEYHEHTSDALFNTMKTGMVGREQPILMVISTAGDDISGPCYEMQLDAQNVLDGTVDDETFFAIIYAADAEDHWTSDEALEKANPNLDVSVSREILNDDREVAKRDARKQNPFMIKHLNLWVQARVSWTNMEFWARQASPELKIADFRGERCWIALDLSSELDLTCAGHLFERGDDLYYFCRSYLPEDTINEKRNHHYQGWEHDGHLIATDGSMIDYERIEKDLRVDLETFDVQEIGYDSWGVSGLEQRLSKDGATMVKIVQNTKTYSGPMKRCEGLIKSGTLFHNDNPVVNWAMSNVTVKPDARDNIFPRKESYRKKIDPAVVLITAIGMRMERPLPQQSVYEERGILAI